MKLQHFVLTRFNVPRADHQADRFGNPILTTEWMAQRVRLFEDICLASMRAQSVNSFRWLCFFGKNTPAKWLPRIESWRGLGNFEAVFVEDSTQTIPEILQRIDAGAEALVTQRLDNDDALHRSAVGAVQSLAHGPQTKVIDLPTGLLLTPDGWKRRYLQCSQFAALYEPKTSAQPFRTVWTCGHPKLITLGPLAPISQADLWITTIHDRNLVNGPFDTGGFASFRVRLRLALRNQLIRLGWWRGEPTPLWKPDRRAKLTNSQLESDFGIDPAKVTALGLGQALGKGSQKDLV